MDLLECVETTQDGWTVVAARGEVDVASSPTLAQAIEGAARSGLDVIVDLAGVSFVDSTGLGVLVQGRNQLASSGRELRLVVRDPNVLKVFEVTALDTVFRIAPTREVALAGG